MELPETIKGQISVNTLGTNFIAEVFAATLSESGISPEQVQVIREGGSRCNVASDIDKVVVRRTSNTEGGTSVFVSANRKGIYDSLPEGLFYTSSFPDRRKSKEDILEEIRRHNSEEFFIRRFFRLFENETDRELIRMRVYELQNDLQGDYRDFTDIFLPYWPFLRKMPIHCAVLFLKLVPHIHTIRQRLPDISAALSLLLDADISVNWHRQYRQAKDGQSHRLKRMKLGAGAILRGHFDDGQDDLMVCINQLKAAEVKRFLQGGDSCCVLHELCGLFFEADREIQIRLQVRHEERRALLKNEQTAYPSYLEINTYL